MDVIGTPSSHASCILVEERSRSLLAHNLGVPMGCPVLILLDELSRVSLKIFSEVSDELPKAVVDAGISTLPETSTSVKIWRSCQAIP
jgi:hypothetical protein